MFIYNSGSFSSFNSHVMPQVFIASLLPRSHGLGLRSVCVRFLVHKVALKEFFTEYFGFFPCRYHSINVPHSSASKCCPYEPDKRAKLGYIPKKQRFFRIGEKSFHFSSSLQAVLYLRCCPMLCLCKCT